MTSKIDFDLPQIGDFDEAALAQLRAGASIALRRMNGDGVSISTSEGLFLGWVPADHLAALHDTTGYCGHIRSLRRDPATGMITSISVRLTQSCNTAYAHKPHATDVIEPDDANRLSQQQLLALAQDEELRWYLRDENLQTAIQGIDSAPSREAALVEALRSPNFKMFTDKVLERVAPGFASNAQRRAAIEET